ncbi:MAG: thiamine phosphate synthase [Phycisphaerae bacterium]|nr:thiamine phosphate synthase [Phycisphaerae bacterium]
MDRSVLRILDASFNRAREGLRVIEDHARMLFDDASLALRAKQLRHQLADVARSFDADALLAARDTPGDVGTRITTGGEQLRPDAESVARAAAKRAAEAMRAIEEYGKLLDADVAARIRQLRYELYAVEQALFIAAPRSAAARNARLHVLLTASLCRGDWLGVAEAVLRGGADVIQLREKNLTDRALLDRASRLRQLTRDHDALLIINDRPDIAVLADADGVHVGEEDLTVADARRIVGPMRLVGASTHNLAEVREAMKDGPDYLGVGPMFASSTKPDVTVNSPELLRTVHDALAADDAITPLVAIGGITADNVARIASIASSRKQPSDGTGSQISIAVAVCNAVIAADQPEEAARKIRAALK